MMVAKTHDWFGKLKGTGAEAKQRAEQDRSERLAEGKRQGSIILNQKDILTGNWDTHKLLFTTLGGQVRPITRDDLVAFRQNIQTAQSRFTKGISAKQIIDWSSKPTWECKQSDLQLAISQIKMAVPVSAQNSRVRFVTNAGPDSEVTRHHVTIEFLNYGAEAASGSSDARKSAMNLRKGPLKIECDCQKFRYFYRYIATIGGFNAGRNETGFPKIKNPTLQGIACKHIVRVAYEIQSGGATLGFLKNLMLKAKSDEEAKAKHALKQIEAEKHLTNQGKRTTGHDIKTSDQKRQERNAKAAAKAVKQAGNPVKPKKASNVSAENAVAALAKAGLSMEQIVAMLKSQGVQ